MKKGLPRIIIGCILIGFQLLSVIGNSLTGNHLGISFTSIYAFIGDLISLLTYYFSGILGVILLISGLIIYNRKDKTLEKKVNAAPRPFFDDTAAGSNQQGISETRAKHNPVQPSSQEEPCSNAAIKHSKYKYCSRCGSPIDPQSKKCTGCGKQFFCIACFKKYILYAIGTLVCVVFLLSAKNNLELQQIIKEQSAIIEQLTTENDELLAQYEEQVEKLELETKIQYSYGYLAGKDEGYSEGYLNGQLAAGSPEAQEIAKDRYYKYVEELKNAKK